MGVLGDRQPSRGISAAVAVGLLKKDDDASIPNGAAPPPRRVGASAARGGRIAPLLPVTTSSKEQASAVQGSARRRRRLAVCGVVTVTLLYLMHRYGGTALQRFQPEALRATFESRGPVGSVVLYVALFCTGEVLHLPGLLFVAVGVLVWGRRIGWLLAVLTAPFALITPFMLVRRLGGQSVLAELQLPMFKRIIERVDAAPLSTVFMLRCFFFMSPAATVALALSHVRLRTYFVGSALGLILPITLGVLFSEQALTFLGYSVPDDSSTDIVAANMARVMWGDDGMLGAIGAALETSSSTELATGGDGVVAATSLLASAAEGIKWLTIRASAVSKLAAATVVTS